MATSTVWIEIRGMRCASCTGAVSRALLETPGVQGADVVLADDSARVEFEAESCSTDTILAAVTKAGFTAQLTDHAAVSRTDDDSETLRRQFVVALMLSIPIPLLMQFHEEFPFGVWMQAGLAVAVQVGPGRTFYRSAWTSVRHRAPNMDALIVTGAIASLAFSAASLAGWFAEAPVFFESAALLVTFVSLGKWLESRARQGARNALRALLDLTPPTARKIDDGVETEVDAATLTKGDRVAVHAGERVPADGVVRRGETTVDESMLTGESTPVPKRAWDDVVGGSINEAAPIEVEITATGGATVLAGIVRMVREAQADTPPIQRLADRISTVFVPAVLLLALVVGVVWGLASDSITTAFLHGTAVVVVACPCALGLATPTAILVGSGIALRRGILIRSGSALEALAGVDRLYLDKTGTLTDGHFEVARIVPARNSSEEDVLAVATALARRSTHPVSAAIAAAGRGAAAQQVDSVEEVRGLGIFGTSDRGTLRIGRRSFLTDHGVDIPATAAEQSVGDDSPTEVWVAVDEEWVGTIRLRDQLRESAQIAVEALKQDHVHPVLLTGDRVAAAKAVAAEVGIADEDVFAELHPGDKLERLQAGARQGEKSAFVGDGINDAPALAAADVGIAIGSGTDVAKETGDIVLVRSDLRDLVRARRISQATLAKIRQNLVWAFLYNLLALPIAAGALSGYGIVLKPEHAALAMALSSVSVVTNSLLLKRRSYEVH